MICHDALNQYWEAGAPDYLKTRGFGPERRARRMKASRYAGRLVGNSPELMPLDSNLFADLEYQTSCGDDADLPAWVTNERASR